MARTKKIEGFELISKEFRSRGITLREMMEKTGIALPTAIRIRRGEPCSLSVAQRVCEVLGLEIVIRKKEQ